MSTMLDMVLLQRIDGLWNQIGLRGAAKKFKKSNALFGKI
jgi:hypothetical protein